MSYSQIFQNKRVIDQDEHFLCLLVSTASFFRCLESVYQASPKAFSGCERNSARPGRPRSCSSFLIIQGVSSSGTAEFGVLSGQTVWAVWGKADSVRCALKRFTPGRRQSGGAFGAAVFWHRRGKGNLDFPAGGIPGRCCITRTTCANISLHGQA